MAPMLASGLAGSSNGFVSSDVALDAPDPVIGSFTLGGLTYSVSPDGLALVSADPTVASDGFVSIPATVTYNTTTYPVTAIGPYAFYLSGATSVELPASIASVDDRAFRTPDVERVEVDPENETYASFDGTLYSADQLRLLLIPGGRQGAVRISSKAEEADASTFSHCAGLDAVSADAGSAHFASWEGLLYDASGSTLLRVPAGATEITIRDGCTAIAAGALEGCAKLERINAPASVTSISPDVFTSIPIVSLPIASLVEEGEGERATGANQLNATVALAIADNALPEVDPAFTEVALPDEIVDSPWETFGFAVSASRVNEVEEGAIETLQESETYRALGDGKGMVVCYPRGANLYARANDGSARLVDPSSRPPGVWCGYTGATFFRLYQGSLWFATTVNGANQQRLGLNTSLTGVTSVGYSTNNSPYATAVEEFSGWLGFNNASVYTYISINEAFETYTANWNANGGIVGDSSNVGSEILSEAKYGDTHTGSYPSFAAPTPTRVGFRFLGWTPNADGAAPIGGYLKPGSSVGMRWNTTGFEMTYYAAWETYTLSFDTSSEPVDDVHEGAAIADRPSGTQEGEIAIDDPARPGYLFQGWAPRAADGTLLPNDTELLGRSDDGSWYVNADKLPGYADSAGTVHLVARWTAGISVDAPLSAAFMYDLVEWDGAEPRDAMVEGQAGFANHSASAVRVCGLESEAAEGASVLVKVDGTALDAAPKGDPAKVLSVFPTTSDATGTEEDAKGPAADDAGDDLAHKVDLALSETIPESAFDAAAWAVPPRGEARVGFRLNLGGSTGVALDQARLVEAVETSGAAPIAHITWCFALA